MMRKNKKLQKRIDDNKQKTFEWLVINAPDYVLQYVEDIGLIANMDTHQLSTNLVDIINLSFSNCKDSTYLNKLNNYLLVNGYLEHKNDDLDNEG